MTWDMTPATASLLVLIFVQTVGFIAAFVRAYDNGLAAKKKAEEAAADLDEYKETNDTRHAVTAAGIALIREQFVRKEDLQHLEVNINRQFEALHKRLDIYFMKRTDE